MGAPIPPLSADRLPTSDWIVHLVTLALVLATLYVAGQPIYANDTWIHLSLGEAFLREGPWLAGDPHLFAAAGPPSPSSWLGSVALYATWLATGFTGLRVAHALVVGLSLALAFRLARGAGASRAGASAVVAGFIVLSTYRLVQLRPELFTIAATLALHPLLIAPREGPAPARGVAAALLAALWANLHAAFVLGPVLVLGAALAVAVASFGPGAIQVRAAERRRALRLALAGLAMLVASGANPQGFAAYLAYFEAGQETLELTAVIDEWGPTNILAWPRPGLPPSLAAWLVCWLCLIGTLGAAAACARERARQPGGAPFRVDPALLALAGAGVAAALVASRFLWLGTFALAGLAALATRASATYGSSPSKSFRLASAALVAFTLAAAVLHTRAGDWRMVSAVLRTEGADYSAPFPTQRYNAHAVWFLADAGLEGRLFNEYPVGGFMSFWLAPRIQLASSGTMNASREAMRTNFAIGARRPLRAGEDYATMLDRQGLDLFLGTGFPVEPTARRPVPCTVRHLEHEPGWLLVFRNLRSAVYLRRNVRNAANLDRVAAYYARAGVPFDRDRGFDAERVLFEATHWAIAQGLAPRDFEALDARVNEAMAAGQLDDSAQRLATIFAVLGLYERAVAIDRFIQAQAPDDATSAWRLSWSLAQMGRWSEAVRSIVAFESRGPGGAGAPPGPWSAPFRELRNAAQADRLILLAHLPALRLDQLDWVLREIELAPARLTRTSTPVGVFTHGKFGIDQNIPTLF